MSTIPCCKCGNSVSHPNSRYMCTPCLTTEIPITKNLTLEHDLLHCRQCERFQFSKNDWRDLSSKSISYTSDDLLASHPFESPEMLSFCLSKLSKQKKFSFSNPFFNNTDFYSKSIKINFEVSREIPELTFFCDYKLKIPVLFTFFFRNSQCGECQRSFTPEVALSTLQLRQRPSVSHMRTLYFLESEIKKTFPSTSSNTSSNNKTKNSKKSKKKSRTVVNEVKWQKYGFDVTFLDYDSVNRAVSFIRGIAPVLSEKVTTKLITHDERNNTEKRNKVILLEICPLNRGDLVLYENSGKKKVCVVNKVTSKVWLGEVEKNELISVSMNVMKKLNSTNKNKGSGGCLKVIFDRKEQKEFEVVHINENENNIMNINSNINMKEEGERRMEKIKVMSEDGKYFECNWGFWTGQTVRVGDKIKGYCMKNYLFNDEKLEELAEEIGDKNVVYGVERVKEKRKKKVDKEIIENIERINI